MRSVADDLRAETHQRAARRTAEQRIALALSLGDDDARLLAAARGVSLAESRRLIARTRNVGRPGSCASRAARP